MKQLVKTVLAKIGISVHRIQKEEKQGIASNPNQTKIIKAVVNQKDISVVIRKHGSDRRVFDQIFDLEEYKNVVELLLQFNGTKGEHNIIDGGANIGLTTLYISQFFPKSNILCVEPDYNNIEMINKNLAANRLERKVKILPGGIWSRTTRLTTRRDFRDGKDWAITVVEADDAEGSIMGFGLLDIMDKYYPGKIVDLLKLDIEGSEAEVFENLDNSNFLNRVFIIAIEIHDEFDCRQNIYDRLTENGFVYFNTGELTVGINKEIMLRQ